MRFHSHIVLVLPFLSRVCATTRVRARQNAPQESPRPVSRSFIVEYTQDHARRKDGIASDPNIKIVKTFESDVFSGAAIETDAYNIDTLGSRPDVLRVWRNNRIQLEPYEPRIVAPDQMRAGEYTIHNATGVNKLHDMGILGGGVIVGVVDTGTWYDHPALGGCFGPGCKVAKGYDLVGDGTWPNEAKTPDTDPKDQRGHGTHVAGIIAGMTDFWTGVAPNATLHSYKVFSTEGTTDAATLIDSFLMAYKDGCDIITASIGGPSGWSTNSWAEVASRLVEQGVVVTISAGNSGDIGPFYGSSGAAGGNVLGIASAEGEMFPASPFQATITGSGGTSNTTTFGYVASTLYFRVVNWPIVPMTLDTSAPADACTPYPAGTPSLEGKIALVRRGTCTFVTKQQNLEAIGATHILIYNDNRAMTTPSSQGSESLMGMVPADVGAAIIQAVKAGGQVTADFSIDPEKPIGLKTPTSGTPSAFTQWGGLYDLQIKPDIAGPGGNIFSTYLDNTFAVLSGTSMSCPYVAGVVALYISAHGGRSVHGNGFAKKLTQRIIASGVSLPWSDGTGVKDDNIAPVPQVGTGLINAFKILQYTTGIEFEKMALNDTHHFKRNHPVTITNGGDKAVQYKFSVQDTAGFEIAGPPAERRLKSFAELVPKKLVPEIRLPSDFSLKPGESKTVSVDFENPDTLGWDSSALPLYSGKIVIAGDNGEQYSIPYMGLAANLERETSPIYQTGYPISESTTDAIDIKDKSSYTFNLSVGAQDFPKIYSKTMWGSREVRWDIYEADWPERDWKYPPVPGEDGYVGPATGWVLAEEQPVFDPSIHNADDTFTFPDPDTIRSAAAETDVRQYWWFGKLGNGSQIELGKYTMRFATLRPFGDPTRSDNWDVFGTPEITVLGKY